MRSFVLRQRGGGSLPLSLSATPVLAAQPDDDVDARSNGRLSIKASDRRD